MNPGRFELLIFDWDGTLCDSASMIVDSMQQAIRDLNLPPREDADISQLIGLGLSEGMQLLYPEIKTDQLLAWLGQYRKSYVGEKPKEPPLFEGVESAMRQLSGAGFRLAVATGKSRAGLDRSLRGFPQIGSLLHASRTADESANKPDPLMLREILALLDVPAERALMIGDTEYDAAMARAIGMPMLGVTCGVHAAERIRSAGAMDLIESVSELPSWLSTNP